MYIHALEMSPHPEHALRAADRLRELVPDGGHLRHMPTHIDIQCGYYQAVVEWNRSAVAADRKLFERMKPPGSGTRCRLRTTTTSCSTGRCSSASTGPRWRRRRACWRRFPKRRSGWRARRWRTGWKASWRCRCTRPSASAGGARSSRCRCPRIGRSTARPPRCCTTPRASRTRCWRTCRRPRRSASVSRPRRPGCPARVPCSTTPA